MLEQAVFGGAERDGLAVAFHLMGHRVHLDIGEFQRLAGQCGAHAAQHGVDAGDQLARAEWLGDIIIRADLEPTDTIVFLAACGEHDDRNIGGGLDLAQLAAHLDAGQIFDHPVEQHDVGRLFARQQQGFLAIRRVPHLKLLPLEMPADQFSQRFVILDQQHAGFIHNARFLNRTRRRDCCRSARNRPSRHSWWRDRRCVPDSWKSTADARSRLRRSDVWRHAR